MMALALAAGLTVISAASLQTSPPTWSCAYVAERLPRTLSLYGDDTVSASETRAARKRLLLSDAILTRAASLALARALGGSRLIVVRCQDDRDQTAIEAQAFDALLPAAGEVVRVARPRSEIAEAIDEIAGRLVSSGARPGPLGFRSPSLLALARAGPALAAPNASERARGLARALDDDPASIDLRLSAVEAEIAARDFDAAVRLASAIPAQDTPPALARALRFLGGAARLEAGRYAEAKDTFEALRLNGETAAVLNNLGVARFRLRDLDASALFARASSLPDQRQKDVSFNQSLALLFEGKADLALPLLQASIEVAPNDAQTRLLMVWALRLLNREAERVREWERLIALAPSYASLGAPDLARRLERIFFSERLPGA